MPDIASLLYLDALPALQVAVPLAAAPLCAVAGRARLAWPLACLAVWAAAAIALALLVRTLDQGSVSYAMGGWAAPLGIAYEIDAANALLLALVSLMAAILMPAARGGFDGGAAPHNAGLIFALALLALAGMLGVIVTGDAFNLYVFLEIASLASYALVACGRDRAASAAAFNYLVQGTVGATFILVGIGLVYMATGTLNMADMAARLAGQDHSTPVQAALAFIVVGAGIKLALFPLHAWLPGAYGAAPPLVSAFLGATATKVGVYILIRFVFGVFGADFSFQWMRIGWVLVPLGLAGAIAGSLIAIGQSDLRRMLAWSSIAQLGYIAAAIGCGNREGLIAAIVHVVNHSLMKGALFLVAAAVIARLGRAGIAEMAGLGRSMPITMACFTVAGLSMIGLPFTVGFVSKWYLVLAAIEAGLWPAVVAVVASSLLAIAYVWRVVESGWFAGADGAPVREAPAVLLVPMLLLAALCVAFGVATDFTVGIAARAADALAAWP